MQPLLNLSHHKDQKQHLELTRDIAQKFNNDFNCKDFLTIPEPLIQKEFSRYNDMLEM